MTQTPTDDCPSHLLALYYRRLYPIKRIIKWLTYGSDPSAWLANREFAFTTEDGVLRRNLFFNTEQHMKREIRNLLPEKIDIGAVYSQPKVNSNSPGIPRSRELVFDIDMSDYDNVRTCCSGASICEKCWRFMSLACKILDEGLRGDFGFKHLLWVFSGRRGVHCWVCDQSARWLDDEDRKAIASYLTVISDPHSRRMKFRGEKLHSFLRKCYPLIKEQFETIILNEQDLLKTEEGLQQLLNVVEEADWVAQLRVELVKYSTSRERWDVATELLGRLQRGSKLRIRHQFLLEEVMFQLLYPRLDFNVTASINHLLKAPYCIHPKSGKVCTPFSVRGADKFDPGLVPTIRMVLHEVDQFDAKNGKTNIKDYKKTSMIKSIMVFEEFLSGLETERKAQAAAPSKESTGLTKEF